MKKVPSVGNFKLGDKVNFKYDDSVMVGRIVEITRNLVIIEPADNPRYYPGYRISLPRLDVIKNTIDMKYHIEPQSNENGTCTI